MWKITSNGQNVTDRENDEKHTPSIRKYVHESWIKITSNGQNVMNTLIIQIEFIGTTFQCMAEFPIYDRNEL